jgi:hypothetical protein
MLSLLFVILHKNYTIFFVSILTKINFFLEINNKKKTVLAIIIRITLKHACVHIYIYE